MHSSTFSSRQGSAHRKLVFHAVALLVFWALILAVHAVSPVSNRNQKNYLFAALDMKEKLIATNDGRKRILLVGGSSIGWSVSAEQLSLKYGVEVINLGVDAGIGYRNIWNLYKEYTRPDSDIIVLSPEFQMIDRDSTTSRVFCDVVFLSKSLSFMLNNRSCIPIIALRTIVDFFYSFLPDLPVSDVYNRFAFNDYGDVVSHLGKRNREFDLFEAADFMQISDKDLSKYEAFVEENLIAKGYGVMVIPTVIPRSSCGGDIEQLSRIQDRLSRLSTFDLTSLDRKEYCYPDRMFFNTAYHMNEQGRQKRTKMVGQYLELAIAKQLERSRGSDTPP